MLIEDYGDYQIQIAKQDRAAYGWAVERADGWRYEHQLLHESMIDAAQAALNWIDEEMMEEDQADRVRDLIARQDQRRIARAQARLKARAEAPIDKEA